jgi:glycosyltransferase involved in cell wall biosynthesis
VKKDLTVLFVAREGSKGFFKPVVQNQLSSLMENEKKIRFISFAIRGKGMKAYFFSILPLLKLLRKEKPNLVHAHYSFSGIIASLVAFRTPVIVSLMGSDIEAKNISRLLILLFSKFSWKATIVKSNSLKEKMGLEGLWVIPNGVDVNRFLPRDQEQCKDKLGWDKSKQQLLFLADPNRREKNFILTQAAYKYLNNSNVELKVIYDVESSKIPTYLNAADVVLLSSLWEGSPNIIKEALSCNRPIVSTNVGDVSHLIAGVDGCFISSSNANDFADKVVQALRFQHVKGRERIYALGYDSNSISDLIKGLYVQFAK